MAAAERARLRASPRCGRRSSPRCAGRPRPKSAARGSAKKGCRRREGSQGASRPGARMPRRPSRSLSRPASSPRRSARRPADRGHPASPDRRHPASPGPRQASPGPRLASPDLPPASPGLRASAVPRQVSPDPLLASPGRRRRVRSRGPDVSRARRPCRAGRGRHQSAQGDQAAGSTPGPRRGSVRPGLGRPASDPVGAAPALGRSFWPSAGSRLLGGRPIPAVVGGLARPLPRARPVGRAGPAAQDCVRRRGGPARTWLSLPSQEPACRRGR